MTTLVRNAWADRAEELAKWTWARLVNREDAWGCYRPDAEIGKEFQKHDGTVGKLGEQRTVNGKLTPGVLVRHFKARDRSAIVGLHTASADNMSKGGALDIDYHGPDGNSPDVNQRAALAWYSALAAKGLRPLLTESNGTGGYHLRLLFAEPVPAERLYYFFKTVTANHASLDMDAPPEQFPKQADVRNCKKGLGNWLRIVGRHHKRPFWSRIWDGSRWLEGDEAIDFVLAFRGDPGSLIPDDMEWQYRIGRYMDKMPNRSEGQGRDDIAFNFLAFMVRDLKLSDEYALAWAGRWDAGNSPPKGPERLREILVNVHDYGQRTYGAGLKPPGHFSTNGDGYRAEVAEAKEEEQRPDLTMIRLGSLVLRLDHARRTGSGRITVPLSVWRKLDRVAILTVSTAGTAKREAVKTLTRLLEGEDVSRADIEQTVENVLCRAAELLERPPVTGSRTVREIVAERVRDELGIAYRGTHGLWSERLGREMTRSDFCAYTSDALIDEAGTAVDAPRDFGGNALWIEVLRVVEASLRLLYGTLVATLPDAPSANLDQDTAAADQFRSAMLQLWRRTTTFERIVREGPTPETVASRASLASRVQTAAKDYIAGTVPALTREKWRPVQRAFDCWWRPWTDDGGQVRILLAMRWTLCGQIGMALPGVVDQASLTALATQYGIARDVPGVSPKLSGGQARVTVLSLEFSSDALAYMMDDDSEEAEEGVQ